MSPQSLLVRQAKRLLSKAQPPVKSKLSTVCCSSRAVADSACMLVHMFCDLADTVRQVLSILSCG